MMISESEILKLLSNLTFLFSTSNGVFTRLFLQISTIFSVINLLPKK